MLFNNTCGFQIHVYLGHLSASATNALPFQGKYAGIISQKHNNNDYDYDNSCDNSFYCSK